MRFTFVNNFLVFRKEKAVNRELLQWIRKIPSGFLQDLSLLLCCSGAHQHRKGTEDDMVLCVHNTVTSRRPGQGVAGEGPYKTEQLQNKTADGVQCVGNMIHLGKMNKQTIPMYKMTASDLASTMQ